MGSDKYLIEIIFTLHKIWAKNNGITADFNLNYVNHLYLTNQNSRNILVQSENGSYNVLTGAAIKKIQISFSVTIFIFSKLQPIYLNRFAHVYFSLLSLSKFCNN